MKQPTTIMNKPISAGEDHNKKINFDPKADIVRSYRIIKKVQQRNMIFILFIYNFTKKEDRSID